MEKIKKWLEQPSIWAKAGAAFAAVCFLCLIYTGFKYINIQTQNLKIQHDEMVNQQIALEAAQKNQQIVSRMNKLAGNLRLKEYDQIASFFENPDEIFTKPYYAVQQDTLIEESALRKDKGDAVILDLENKSLYVGKVDDSGLRSGYGLQFGYSPNYVAMNENYEKITYPAAHVYRGSFRQNMAQGKGEYEQIHSILHDSQKKVTISGNFNKAQMNGYMDVVWMDKGKEYSDTIYVDQGTMEAMPSLGEGYVYARAWDFFKPVTLKVYDPKSLENTFVWHDYLNHYLEKEQLVSLRTKNFAVI